MSFAATSLTVALVIATAIANVSRLASFTAIVSVKDKDKVDVKDKDKDKDKFNNAISKSILLSCF